MADQPNSGQPAPKPQSALQAQASSVTPKSEKPADPRLTAAPRDASFSQNDTKKRQ